MSPILKRSFLTLLFLCFAFPLFSNEPALLPIKLEKQTWFIKKGFDSSFTKLEFGLEENGFTKVDKFPILPNRIYNVPISGDVNEFTLIIDFNVKTNRIEPGKELAFSFSGIGETWSVYLNEELIQDEFGFSPRKVEKYKSIRNVKILIPYGLISEKNRLVIRLAGYSPASFLTPNILLGLRFNEGYVLDYEKDITAGQYQLLDLILNSIYIFFGLYHLFFFIRMPQKRYNLYFGIFSIAISLYFLAFSNITYTLFSDTRFLYFVAFVVQAIALLSFIMFLKDYFYPDSEVNLFYKYVILSNFFVSLFYIFLPINFYHTILYSWYIFALPQILFIFYFIIDAIRKSMKDSIPMALSISIILLIVIWEILDTIFFQTGIRLFQYSYFLFILSLVFILANRFIEINWETKRLNIELTSQRDSFSKFVPVQFLEALGKKAGSSIQPGECRLQEMTILFSDIRDFTSLSESMTPEENFRFINSYLGRMSPIIQRNHGFIDKFIGDAIMAIFSNPDDALQASCEIFEELKIFNFHRARMSYKPINLGIGINTGMLMMGTVGHENRMNTTVIGDSVNLASRLESITKKYKTGILISEHIYSKLKNLRNFDIRFIDTVVVKGKTEKIRVFECFNPDEPQLKEIKFRSADYLKEYLEYRESNQHTRAHKVLNLLKEQFAEDPIANYHSGIVSE